MERDTGRAEGLCTYVHVYTSVEDKGQKLWMEQAWTNRWLDRAGDRGPGMFGAPTNLRNSLTLDGSKAWNDGGTCRRAGAAVDETLPFIHGRGGLHRELVLEICVRKDNTWVCISFIPSSNSFKRGDVFWQAWDRPQVPEKICLPGKCSLSEPSLFSLKDMARWMYELMENSLSEWTSLDSLYKALYLVYTDGVITHWEQLLAHETLLIVLENGTQNSLFQMIFSGTSAGRLMLLTNCGQSRDSRDQWRWVKWPWFQHRPKAVMAHRKECKTYSSEFLSSSPLTYQRHDTQLLVCTVVSPTKLWSLCRWDYSFYTSCIPSP